MILPRVEGNKVQLQQVILNLVANAIDAMQGAGLRSSHVSSVRNNPATSVMTIEDTGMGIDPDKFDLVFKPLFTTKTNGMGMGLSISRSIVAAHGGQITARSAAGGGSTFEFELPGKEKAQCSRNT